MELNQIEEDYLKELINVHAAGESVGGYIFNRLYKDRTSMYQAGVGVFAFRESFHDDFPIYKSLALKGMIEADTPIEAGSNFGLLTSDGLNYFTEKERKRREKAKEKWADWRRSLLCSIVVLVLNVALSAFISRCSAEQVYEELSNGNGQYAQAVQEANVD